MVGLPRLVWIRWQDSAQAAPHWQWLDEINGPEIVECLTVGFLVGDNTDQKRVAVSIGAHGAEATQAAGIVAIPSRCIVDMGSLTLPFSTSDSAASPDPVVA